MPRRTSSLREQKVPIWEVGLAGVCFLLSFGALMWAFIFKPHLTADSRPIANFFFAFSSGFAGSMWQDIVLRVRGKLPGGGRYALDALGGSALFAIAMWGHPLFSTESIHALPVVKIERICGQFVDVGRPSLLVEPACEIDGQISGAVDPDTRLCILVRDHAAGMAKEPSRTCIPVETGKWSIGRILLRDIGSGATTRSEIIAGLMADGDAIDFRAVPTMTVVEVNAPEVSIESIEWKAGFKASGHAKGLLDEEELAIQVETTGGERPTSSYLIPEAHEAGWTAEDRRDARVERGRSYRLTSFLGPKSAAMSTIHGLPPGFRQVGVSREFQRD